MISWASFSNLAHAPSSLRFLNPGMLEYGDSKTLAAFVVQHTHPGAVVLLHNGQRSTLEALPDIIAGLRRRGFQFVTVEELDRRLRRR